MSKEDVFRNLQNACKQLKEIGNLGDFRRDNSDDVFFGILQPVIQNYRFIQNNYPEDTVLQSQAAECVKGIALMNPSLSAVVEEIVNPNREERQAKKEFLNSFNTRLEEFERARLSEDNLDEYETLLGRLQAELEQNMGMFTNAEYEELIGRITVGMNKIDGIKRVAAIDF